jgi:hypothetical protein
MYDYIRPFNKSNVIEGISAVKKGWAEQMALFCLFRFSAHGDRDAVWGPMLNNIKNFF